MIRDGNILIAFLLCGSGNLFDGRRPVAPFGMDMKVSLDFGFLNQFRKPPLLRRFDLSTVFTKLRFYPIHPQHTIDILLFLSSNFLLSLKDTIFIDLDSLGLGDSPQMNVVPL